MRCTPASQIGLSWSVSSRFGRIDPGTLARLGMEEPGTAWVGRRPAPDDAGDVAVARQRLEPIA